MLRWEGAPMAGRNITLTIPDELYARLQQNADLTQRSIADEALEAVAMALPTVASLPPASARALARMADLTDDELWQEARRTLPRRDERRLRLLAHRRQRGTLPVGGEQELEVLLDRLEDVGLIRARAAALLKSRGHDVSAILPR